MHLVKLGGSLLKAPHQLRAWLRTIATTGGGRVVIVPGGGPFADAVRRAQGEYGFDDRAAHRMALLAMEQCGLALASIERSLVPSDTFAGLRRVLREGRIPVWMPHRSAADADDVPANWNATSDSLAAWLARELDASSLWLVKSCAVPVQAPERLAAMGIVDFAFPKFCERSPFAVHVVGIDDRPRLVASLLEEAVNAVPTAAS